jgi:hypothetical protein
MHSLLRRVGPAASGIAVAVSLLALVAAAAGAGYAGVQIGTDQIKNNAITAKKIHKGAVTTKKIKKNAVTGAQVKDGSLSTSDLPAEEKYKPVTFFNGGEGDCVWQNADAAIPGLGNASIRKDRNGIVHLSGVAVASNGSGGDGSCDYTDPGQDTDAVAYILPAGYIPFKTLLIPVGSNGVIIAGPNGLTSGGITLPPGAVYTAGTGTLIQDNIQFEAAGSPTVARVAASGRVTPAGAKLLKSLGFGS